jgi:unsaturated rhamnogalacturonyl hydrolase
MAVIISFSFILLTIIATVLLIDIIPLIRDWLGRIHIGRYSDENKWNRSIVNVGLKWLNNTPKIKVTDNTRLVALDMLHGNYTKSAIQHWQEASLILGLSEYTQQSGDKEAKDRILKFLKTMFNCNGQWIEKPKHVDAAILAYAVMKADSIRTDTNKYKHAFDYIWKLIKEHIGKDGTVRYRNSMESYRYVDTIGFICPFLIAYGIKYNKQQCVQLAIKQIKEYEKYGMLQEHHIPSHAYKIENKVPLGLYGWGRGCGWFAIGLIDSWRELPEDNLYKAELEEIIKKFAKSAMSFQQKNGCWNWSVTRNESRADSSTTVTLGWFMLNAAQVNDSSGDYLKSAEKAINYLMSVTRKNGTVDFSQGDTKDIGVYSTLFNILPFTQGFCIRMINFYNKSKAGRYYDKKIG